MHFLCKLGFHSWDIIQLPRWYMRCHGLSKVPVIRMCRRCEAKEKQELHCLGMNPPKYLIDWIPYEEEFSNEKGTAEVFVDEAGCLFVRDKTTGNCYTLSPKDSLGDIKLQGNYTSLGEYHIGKR